jgi:hypothetical protein
VSLIDPEGNAVDLHLAGTRLMFTSPPSRKETNNEQ